MGVGEHVDGGQPRPLRMSDERAACAGRAVVTEVERRLRELKAERSFGGTYL